MYQQYRKNFLNTFCGIAKKDNLGVLFWRFQANTHVGDVFLSTDMVTLTRIKDKIDKAVLVISGTHGIEGSLGAEFQLKIMGEVVKKGSSVIPEGTAIVFVFALNPWGFFMGQRTDENNIDLNRNALEEFSQHSSEYDKIHSLITPDSWNDETVGQIMQGIQDMGMDRFKNILSGGQYSQPQGLFYGGMSTSSCIVNLRRIVKYVIDMGVKKLAVLDVHTGLGVRGKGVVISSAGRDDKNIINTTRGVFGDNAQFPNSGISVSSAVSGDILSAINQWCYGCEVLPIAIEVGTESVDFAIPPVDFCMMAEATGANAHKIRDPEDFEHIDYQALCRRNGPTLLEVYIDPEEAPPIGMF